MGQVAVGIGRARLIRLRGERSGWCLLAVAKKRSHPSLTLEEMRARLVVRRGRLKLSYAAAKRAAVLGYREMVRRVPFRLLNLKLFPLRPARPLVRRGVGVVRGLLVPPL
jgi:hypothetical protein